MPGIEDVKFLQRSSCPLHPSPASPEEGLLPGVSLREELTGRAFQLLKCRRCGTLLTDPYPSEDTAKWLYEGRSSEDNFDPMRGTLIDHLKDFSARRDLRHAHRLAGRPPFRAVLDFGTGNGRFALASRMTFPGCRVDAVDLHSNPPPGLAGVEGIRYLSAATWRSEACLYDLIILRHVLEHLHDPAGFLASLLERLAPAGVLYLEVPNIRSAQVRWFATAANAYFLPYHLFHFDRSALATFLRSMGLDSRIETKTLPIAGCVLAAALKQPRTMVHQLAGIALHPLQMLLDRIYGKSVLAAVCARAADSGLRTGAGVSHGATVPAGGMSR